MSYCAAEGNSNNTKYSGDDNSLEARLRRRRDKREVDANGFALMTLAYLQQLSREQKGYCTPHLNDTLYLHFKGFAKIGEALLQYTGLKSLWLESNALSSLENMDALTNLRCLYLQDNCVSDFSGIVHLQQLRLLNISSNGLLALPRELTQLPALETLHATKNRFGDAQALDALLEMRALTVLDLNHSGIECAEVIEDVILRIPAAVAVLTMQGNPLLKRTTNYRRRMISGMKSLTYLDERPVDDGERARVAAWFRGGDEAERGERARQQAEVRAEHERGFAALAALQQRNRAAREERERAARAARDVAALSERLLACELLPADAEAHAQAQAPMMAPAAAAESSEELRLSSAKESESEGVVAEHPPPRQRQKIDVEGRRQDSKNPLSS